MHLITSFWILPFIFRTARTVHEGYPIFPHVVYWSSKSQDSVFFLLLVLSFDHGYPYLIKFFVKNTANFDISKIQYLLKIFKTCISCIPALLKGSKPDRKQYAYPAT